MFLEQVIESHRIKRVLEIGTAIGYSALFMVGLGCHVTTIERDPNMIAEAKKNLKVAKEVTLIEADALIYDGPLATYDLIFIDGAKAQYQRFFEKYTPFLAPGGLVICDNLHFHHLKPEEVNRHTKQLLRKIAHFKTYLQENTFFSTTFYDVGDGMSISKKVKL